MYQDTTAYDSLAHRPLPKWLTDQRDGLNTVRPVVREMKDDRSLETSFAITGVIILIVIIVLTIVIIGKKKRKSL
jgi:hypothetical protein